MHWLGLVVVIKPPGIIKISNLSSRNGEPVYVAGVRRADNTLVTGWWKWWSWEVLRQMLSPYSGLARSV